MKVLICKSGKLLVKFESLFLTVFLLLSTVCRDVAYASSPTEKDYGCFVGSVTISKADLPDAEDNAQLALSYSVKSQELDLLKEKYEGKGTVHYKIGENGEWKEGIPSLKDVGDYDLYYYVEGDANHNNLRSKENPLKLSVSIFVPKDDWGTKVDSDGYTYYVTPDGETSAEIDKYGIIWLKEESDGTYAWYGVDNTSGIFALGSRFWVKWLSPEKDTEEYQKYLEQLDEASKAKAEEGKLWIFETGVTSPDGVEYTNLGTAVPYYIQLGKDWDSEDVSAYYISKEKDEKLTPEIGNVDYFNSSSDKIVFPESSEYARLHLKHFSPYVIMDEKDDFEELDVNDIKLKYTGANQNIDKFNSLYENGTVYYKIGKNGTWTKGIPSFKDVGDYDLYYYVKGNDKYNDLGSEDSPILVKVSVEDLETKAETSKSQNDDKYKVTDYDKSYYNKNTGDDAYMIKYMITIFAVSLTVLVMLFLELISKKRKMSHVWSLLKHLFLDYEVYNLTNCDYSRISNSDNLGRKLSSKCKFINFEMHYDKNTIDSLDIMNKLLKTTRLRYSLL